ncbi:MAG: GNAT family N-acetyltransferase [Phocaeicola sp.]
MLKLTPIKTTDSVYPFVEQLLHDSFPLAERRDDEAQRDNTDHNPRFTCYFISDDELPVGLITAWNLDGFYYLEHLATTPLIRNRGYGKQIIQQIKDLLPGVIVLEVEHPEDEMSRRRIGFYQRCGFQLCEKEYIQPPYREGGEEVPLFLMYSGTDSIDDAFDTIRQRIYKEVYGV